MKMCSLAEILNQIIIHIYDPVRQSTEAQIQECVDKQGANLEKWWNELPPFLKLIPNNLPTYCPPSHVVTLKYVICSRSSSVPLTNSSVSCIYHTTNILLHRPMLCSRPFRTRANAASNANHLVQCLSSASSNISLYDLFRRTFGDSHVVLSLAYSLYTAASIFILEIQALKYASPSTLEKLRYCILALERVKAANPGMPLLSDWCFEKLVVANLELVIHTALGLIEKELKKLRINIFDTPANPDQQTIPAVSPQTTTSSPPSSLDPLHSQHMYTLPPHGAFSITPPPADPQQTHQQQQQPLPHQNTTFIMDTPPLPDPPDFIAQDRMYDIAPELFEAFSYAEPNTPGGVGAGFDSTNWAGTGPTS